jgi:hypothetical protein
MAPSMPSERSRRCAVTVNPPTAIRAMSSRPSVSAVSVMVCGLSRLVAATVAGDSTPGPMLVASTPGASNSTLTCVGARTWPGATRANWSSRFSGFVTMPVTRRAVPPPRHADPIFILYADATPLVTAT